ncbi:MULTISPECIES: cell envelope integrity protein CreD [unclassified Variovorax]|jgi:inner membrane protein|uniref:cell envelope integrity protein CreD n=1 Tax=unclassified Variovorax TaxID=663243 RepID=UPI000F7D74E3|nr:MULTISPECIES: cell envelope integrity protein CreD [unclassified Variovorax]RSZ38187.1 cell envelope integrity protein CreD [Variovorax sp. 553]RSZ39361.1 cell envelope integrity protein CreD [Variovorax sp. 679]
MLQLLKALQSSMLAKVAGLFFLLLLLCIPLGEIDSINRARGESQREAASELAATYAGRQTMVGPLLLVPYVEKWMEPLRNAQGKVIGQEPRSKEMAHVVFPDKLHVEGSMAPQERYRGIFRIPFYTLDATLTGGFAAFDPKAVSHSEADSKIEFKAPLIAFNVSDLRGLDGSPTIAMDGEALRFKQRVPGLADDASFANGIHAPVTGAALAAWQAGKPVPFEMKLGLVGQDTLAIAPIAEETTAHLRSPWAHPSFGGRFLAAERSVTPQGFDAHWRVSSLVTSAREQVRAGLSGRGGPADVAGSAEAATVAPATHRNMGPLQTFDVSLAQPINVYSMSTRAGKYGALFIGLVLMAAFMFELFRKLRLHPIQYGLVGLSIALFFLLLLALSEKFAFWMAYTGAASASVALLAVYFSAVLGGWRRGLSFGAFVALLYGALYGLLASESNALLLGALLIFGMLATLMLVTRKVDWYALSRRTETTPVTAPEAQAA